MDIWKLMSLKSLTGGGSGGGSGMGGADWNAAEGEPGHVLNRTHYEVYKEVKFTFDGDMNGKIAIPYGDVYFVKVADTILTVDQIKVGTVSVWESGQDTTITVEQMAESMSASSVDEIITDVSGTMGIPAIQVGTGSVMVIYNSFTMQGFTVPAGTYFLCVPSYKHTSGFSFPELVIKKLDNKYIDAEWMATKKLAREVFAEITAVFEGQDGMASTSLMAGEAVPFATGETYKLTLDGEEYTCVAKEDSFFDGRMYYLGEPRLAGLDIAGEGENFLVLTATGDGVSNAYFVATTTVGTHTVQLEQITGVTGEPVYNKLPVEYLPDNVATKEYVEQVILGGAW